MLSKILSGSECASCRFCCSFRRQSLWETPLFTSEEKESLQRKYPEAKFRPAENSSWTIDLSSEYKTSDPEEEAPCWFLDPHKGCILGKEEKPFDCSIWPLRIMSRQNKKVIALTPTCPAVNKVPAAKIKKLVDEELSDAILKKAEENPDMIKSYREGFPVIKEL